MGTANKETMVQLTIDVDYPYPSRIKSFFYTVAKLRLGKDYLKNSKTIARMVNESKRDVKAYWFFTPTTTPDEELLRVLGREKHEVALHVVKNPNAELRLLEKAARRKIIYYNIHGTERLVARIMWGRKPGEARAHVPKDFPLKYIYERPPLEMDVLCYSNPTSQVVKTAEANITIGVLLHLHPEWLFKRGTINRRGPVYEALKKILRVDQELDTLAIWKKGLVRIARDVREYQEDFVPTDEFAEKLAERGIDVFTFIERKWCCTIPKPSDSWVKTEDNIALLQVTDYDQWWENIGKKTRNMVRKAEKSGIKTEVAEPNEKLAEGIWRIYNETPIRQERAFPHYGAALQTVKSSVFSAQDSTFIGAFFQDELEGFIQLSHGDKIAIISQILSFQKDSDKAVNNALVAKAVEVCAAKQIRWLMYGRMGNHPSLDKFKQSNGFAKLPLTRYYIPLTKKGKLTIRLGLHREVKDALPQAIKNPLIPLFNWVSRTKMKARLALNLRATK
jgi:hypothetical protein